MLYNDAPPVLKYENKYGHTKGTIAPYYNIAKVKMLLDVANIMYDLFDSTSIIPLLMLE